MASGDVLIDKAEQVLDDAVARFKNDQNYFPQDATQIALAYLQLARARRGD